MTYAGFYGKLAGRGDFVSRDLPQAFIQPWDRWLAAGLLASQQQLGNDWLQAYLVSPLWRFVLAPGVCGPQAVAGVLMPSIDRVGRYFPLTVAAVLDEPAPLSPWLAVDDWFEQVEALMLDSLTPDNRFEAFEAGLQALPVPTFEAAAVAEVQGDLQRLAATTAPTRLAVLAEQGCVGASLWWGRGGEHIAPGLWRCKGLPDAADFARALLGHDGAGVEGQA
ncbi:type VI secretion system-associated protein TagF [Pseudomonas syringae]|nr:type VI secretion system-associated protein TagF [Pseudomonas syringae]MBD8792163.1 type VI secretion system-associated protein TagF [Pseudomonas syringae]MBD8803425.1 type VI secretion system-associated protein TagF [Pseudomonas syringae]MBD8814585.1 type VI secretion system-associated protein TagF [Pseudomonas syringae]